MNLKIHSVKETKIAELTSDNIEFNTVQDILDLMANAYYMGARKIIIKEENITPEFFQLGTGIAGEILQKFSNYKVELAIIGDYSKYKSKNFRDFIYESNKYGNILFLPSVEEALEKLSG